MPLIPSPYEDSFNSIRVIVAVELVPLSNKYSQFEFTKETWLKLSDFLQDLCDKVDDRSFDVPLGDPVFILPEGVENWTVDKSVKPSQEGV